MTRSTIVSLALIGLAIAPLPALAQARAAAPPLPFRAFVTINGGYQATSNDFGESSTFTSNVETGRLETDYSVRGGPTLDVSGAAMVWRQLAVGVGVTRFSRSTPLTFTSSVPHPFFFNQPRSVEAEVGGLKRQEIGIHIQARGLLPTRGRIQATVFGGPSFFRVSQDVLSNVVYAEQYPYDIATVGQTQTTRARESALGFNVGGDVAYFFSRQLGVGFTGQYSGASVDMPSPDGGTTDVRTGGLQAGGGLRLRF